MNSYWIQKCCRMSSYIRDVSSRLLVFDLSSSFLYTSLIEKTEKKQELKKYTFSFSFITYRLVSNTHCLVVCLLAPPKGTKWTFLVFSLHFLFCNAKLILNFCLPGTILGCLALLLLIFSYILFIPSFM